MHRETMHVELNILASIVKEDMGCITDTQNGKSYLNYFTQKFSLENIGIFIVTFFTASSPLFDL